ncbi:MAG: MerR family transcriptional regulator [Ruminococcaceae bacterium]|nr:MerR family transcriptional regulator [Oscillospiraceae bacterium]
MKGGDWMGYSVKWVVDNLGITRDMLRYYEKEKLLPTSESRNPTNKYRDYSDEDIERIWGIKLLIGIGFSAKEIFALMNDPEYDFEAAIAKKVEELERKHDENVLYLEFTKSIKLTGRIPTASKIGSVRFDDFLAYAYENWNFYDEPRSASFMKTADTLISKEPQEWSPADMERILELFNSCDAERMMHIYALHGYFQVLADMRSFGFDSDTVQRVVRLLHEYLIDHTAGTDMDEINAPHIFAKYTASFFLGGDIMLLHERNYGEEGCRFIAQAIAHYGGYNIDDL